MSYSYSIGDPLVLVISLERKKVVETRGCFRSFSQRSTAEISTVILLEIIHYVYGGSSPSKGRQVYCVRGCI